MKFLFFYICGMMKKWYFGTLLTLLTMLVIVQQQTVVPNQEIVLEFINAEVTSVDAQNAITNVKKRLESIGVKYTRVSKSLEDGKLKIAYYSDADIEFIKKVLSKDQNVELDLDHVVYDQNKNKDQFPLNKNSKDYNLDVYEIQKSTDFNTDFNGKYVLEVNQKRDGYSGYNGYTFAGEIDVNKDGLIKVAQKVYSKIAIAIDNTSRNIPEVRAGPIS